MFEHLPNEIEAINSIYGEGTLEATDQARIYVLRLPNRGESLRIQFPDDYPDGSPPAVLGTHTLGDRAKKGSAAQVVDAFRDAIRRLFRVGDVCLFDVMEDVEDRLGPSSPRSEPPAATDRDDGDVDMTSQPEADALAPPPWTVSEVVTELRSVFVARCARITSPDQALSYRRHLLATDKKVAKATHNITAHRIRGVNGVVFQDCDDDGEAAAGGRLLHLMQLMDLWDVMVVVTRWYGGLKLGPARFGIINTVARDAFVKAGLVTQEPKKATR